MEKFLARVKCQIYRRGGTRLDGVGVLAQGDLSKLLVYLGRVGDVEVLQMRRFLKGL